MPGLAVAKGGEVELFLLLEPPDGGGAVCGQLLLSVTVAHNAGASRGKERAQYIPMTRKKTPRLSTRLRTSSSSVKRVKL